MAWEIKLEKFVKHELPGIKLGYIELLIQGKLSISRLITRVLKLASKKRYRCYPICI